MIRTFFTPTSEERSITLTLPESLVGQQVEILAFAVEGLQLPPAVRKQAPTFTALRLDTKGFTFNRDEANA